jgi:NADH dehydrogenase
MAHYTTVTVFGGTGFIGRYLIDKLADLNVIVRVATRSPSRAYFLRTAGTVGQVVPILCNIHDDNSVQQAIQGSDWVINLVGELNEGRGKNSFEKIHHEFPARIAALAAKNKVQRLVHVSALGASLSSKSVYAQTKYAGEVNVSANFPEATILRPSVVYGPEDRFFNFFAKMASIAPFLPLIGGGKTQFQPVYVGDVVKAIIASLKQPEENVQGKIFELGGDEVLSFKSLMQKMAQFTGQKSKLLSIPFPIAKIQGAVFQMLPGSLLTIDQVKQLQSDNVVSGTKPGLHELGITPENLDAILPAYLTRFRGGRFAYKRTA